MSNRFFVIEFTEGELAELLMIIDHEMKHSTYYPDYYQRLNQKIRGQVNYQISNHHFKCAVCAERARRLQEV